MKKYPENGVGEREQIDSLKKQNNVRVSYYLIEVSAVFLNNSGCLDYSRIEIAVAARPQPMKL
jgi:hypothetical protein